MDDLEPDNIPLKSLVGLLLQNAHGPLFLHAPPPPLQAPSHLKKHLRIPTLPFRGTLLGNDDSKRDKTSTAKGLQQSRQGGGCFCMDSGGPWREGPNFKGVQNLHPSLILTLNTRPLS
ncbi:hypothetical protein SUGI_1036800 [Cryptomeria japonica]|nr:hypothetical protein SUGI_1036800 [Cryptomeria japonica]